jgi:hypothetical protein
VDAGIAHARWHVPFARMMFARIRLEAYLERQFP